MKNYTVGYFDEKQGVKSYTRLTSFVAFIVACVITFYSIYTNQSNFELIVTFLAYSGGQKIAQKFTESAKEAEIGKG